MSDPFGEPAHSPMTRQSDHGALHALSPSARQSDARTPRTPQGGRSEFHHTRGSSYTGGTGSPGGPFNPAGSANNSGTAGYGGSAMGATVGSGGGGGPATPAHNDKDSDPFALDEPAASSPSKKKKSLFSGLFGGKSQDEKDLDALVEGEEVERKKILEDHKKFITPVKEQVKELQQAVKKMQEHWQVDRLNVMAVEEKRRDRMLRYIEGAAKALLAFEATERKIASIAFAVQPNPLAHSSQELPATADVTAAMDNAAQGHVEEVQEE